jgi:hypothetical protein
MSSVAPLGSTATQAVEPAATPPSLLFVADALRQQVRIYDPVHKTLYGKIPLVVLPGGLAVDASKNLYVASLGGVTMYAPPYNHPGTQYTMLADRALAVAVAPNGTVAAIDGQNIFLFSAGSSQPCMEYAPPNYGRLTSVAFDGSNNLYFTGYDTSRNVAISEMPGQCGNGESTPLTIGNALRSVDGVVIGSSGQLSLLDTKAKTIFTYNPPVSGSLGNPVDSTLLQRGENVRNPVAFIFDGSGKSVYTADSTSGVVDEFSFPQGGPPRDTLVVGGQPIGIAIVPPYLPKGQQ